MTDYIDVPWDRAGITYRQYDHWVTKGYLPGIGNPGYGTERVVTREQFEHLAKMAKLVKGGMVPKAASDYATAGKADAIYAAMVGDDGA
jgi:hypothetical protein